MLTIPKVSACIRDIVDYATAESNVPQKIFLDFHMFSETGTDTIGVQQQGSWDHGMGARIYPISVPSGNFL